MMWLTSMTLNVTILRLVELNPQTFNRHQSEDSHSFLIFCAHQFSDETGTPVQSSGFCGQRSLMNAEVLFKSTYTKESGETYGAVSLDKHTTVKRNNHLCVK